jgi:hypothetical protein
MRHPDAVSCRKVVSAASISLLLELLDAYDNYTGNSIQEDGT